MGSIRFHEGDLQTGGGEAGKAHDLAHEKILKEGKDFIDVALFLNSLLLTDRKCRFRGHEHLDWENDVN